MATSFHWESDNPLDTPLNNSIMLETATDNPLGNATENPLDSSSENPLEDAPWQPTVISEVVISGVQSFAPRRCCFRDYYYYYY